MFRRMFTRCSGVLLLLATAASADVTIRQTMEFQFKMPMPGVQALPAPFNGPIQVVSRVKGDRAYSSFGPLISITDSAKNEVTLIDEKGKRYATTVLSDYLAQMQKTATGGADMPEQVKQLLANIKVEVTSTDTGRSERILGIDAAEREVEFHMTIPLPVPGQEKGLEIVGKFQIWKPKAGQEDKVAALAELEKYYAHAGGFGDSSAMLRQMFSSMPGLGDNLKKLTEEMGKGGHTNLRMHGAIFMPGLAAMMAQAKASGANVPDFPADGPLMEIRMEMSEVNTDAVPDSLFAIPADYQQAPIEDLAKMMMPAGMGGAKPAAPAKQ